MGNWLRQQWAIWQWARGAIGCGSNPCNKQRKVRNWQFNGLGNVYLFNR